MGTLCIRRKYVEEYWGVSKEAKEEYKSVRREPMEQNRVVWSKQVSKKVHPSGYLLKAMQEKIYGRPRVQSPL